MEEIKRVGVATVNPWEIEWLITLVEAQEGEIERLTKNADGSVCKTCFSIAWIETANGDVCLCCKLKNEVQDLGDGVAALANQLTAERETKERAWNKIDDLSKQLGEAYDQHEVWRGKVEKLRKALKFFADMGWEYAKQALDSEEGK